MKRGKRLGHLLTVEPVFPWAQEKRTGKGQSREPGGKVSILLAEDEADQPCGYAAGWGKSVVVVVLSFYLNSS